MYNKDRKYKPDNSEQDFLAHDLIDLNEDNTQSVDQPTTDEESNRHITDVVKHANDHGDWGWLKWVFFPLALKLDILMFFLPKSQRKKIKNTIRDMLS